MTRSQICLKPYSSSSVGAPRQTSEGDPHDSLPYQPLSRVVSNAGPRRLLDETGRYRDGCRCRRRRDRPEWKRRRISSEFSPVSTTALAPFIRLTFSFVLRRAKRSTLLRAQSSTSGPSVSVTLHGGRRRPSTQSLRPGGDGRHRRPEHPQWEKLRSVDQIKVEKYPVVDKDWRTRRRVPTPSTELRFCRGPGRCRTEEEGRERGEEGRVGRRTFAGLGKRTRKESVDGRLPDDYSFSTREGTDARARVRRTGGVVGRSLRRKRGFYTIPFSVHKIPRETRQRNTGS